MSRALGIGVLLAISAPAMAQTQDTDIRPYAESFTADDLRATFSDNIFDGAYGFARNGKARSFYREVHRPDGTVTYTEDGVTLNGTWSILRDQLCFAYETAAMAGGCFRVYEVGNCLYFYASRQPEQLDMTGKTQWVARAVRDDDTPQCDAPTV